MKPGEELTREELGKRMDELARRTRKPTTNKSTELEQLSQRLAELPYPDTKRIPPGCNNRLWPR